MILVVNQHKEMQGYVDWLKVSAGYEVSFFDFDRNARSSYKDRAISFADDMKTLSEPVSIGLDRLRFWQIDPAVKSKAEMLAQFCNIDNLVIPFDIFNADIWYLADLCASRGTKVTCYWLDGVPCDMPEVQMMIASLPISTFVTTRTEDADLASKNNFNVFQFKRNNYYEKPYSGSLVEKIRQEIILPRLGILYDSQYHYDYQTAYNGRFFVFPVNVRSLETAKKYFPKEIIKTDFDLCDALDRVVFSGSEKEARMLTSNNNLIRVGSKS